MKGLAAAALIALLRGARRRGREEAPATGHVFIITLENKNFDVDLRPASEAPYLAGPWRARARCSPSTTALGTSASATTSR